MSIAVLHKPSQLSNRKRRETLRRRARKLLQKVALEESELTLVLCDDAFIQKLNATWRGEARPTDVLSFPQNSPETMSRFLMGEGVAPPLLGDIVISLEQVRRQHQGSEELEIERLLVHGVAHLLGHDHQNDHEAECMESLERILAGHISKALEHYVSASQSGNPL